MFKLNTMPFHIALLTAIVSGCASTEPYYPWLELTTDERSDVLFASQGVKRRAIDFNDMKIEFVELTPEDWGSEDWTNAGPSDVAQGRDTTWVMVHGIGGSMGDLTPFIPAKPTQRILFVNLPGHGGSLAANHEYAIGNDTRALHRVLLTTEVSRAHFVCHSLGGHVCVDLLLDHPEYAESLTLISPSGIFDIEGFIRYLQRDFAGLNDGATPTYVAQFIESKKAGLDYDWLKAFLSYAPRAIAAASVVRDTVRDRLHELDMPTLLLWGLHDPLFAVEDAFFLHHQIEGSVLKLADVDNHSPQFTHPHLSRKWLHEFIHGLDHPES